MRAPKTYPSESILGFLDFYINFSQIRSVWDFASLVVVGSINLINRFGLRLALQVRSLGVYFDHIR